MILACTDCRPTQGIDEAVARIEMYVEEGADILFLDSPADESEIQRAVTAAGGKPSFVVLSPGAPRATPSQARAAELGFKIATYPTAMLSPAAPWPAQSVCDAGAAPAKGCAQIDRPPCSTSATAAANAAARSIRRRQRVVDRCAMQVIWPSPGRSSM